MTGRSWLDDQCLVAVCIYMGPTLESATCRLAENWHSWLVVGTINSIKRVEPLEMSDVGVGRMPGYVGLCEAQCVGRMAKATFTAWCSRRL